MGVDKNDLEALKMLANEVHFASGYNFLIQHNGWRPGKTHVILGVSHGGKSTLVRSLVSDTVRTAKSIGVYLSEESESEFITELAHAGFTAFDRLKIYSEQDLEIVNNKTAGAILVKCFDENEIVFLDNITTSILYADKPVKEQTEVALKLKKLAKVKAKPLVIVAHAGKKIGSGYNALIEMDDIRGGSTLVNIAHFFYVMQTIFIGSSRFVILRITKHRGQSVSDTIYSLIYNKEKRVYGEDLPIPFSVLAEKFKMRNKL